MELLNTTDLNTARYCSRQSPLYW